MAIRKIKLPGEQEPREIGALSSNIVYDAVTPTVSLNQKISSMDQIIEGLNSFEIAIVNSLPTEDIDDHTIYFVPQSQGSTTHDEYMYINGAWELIGTTTIDLSDYLQKTDITIVQGLTTGIPAATITVGATTTTLYAPTPTSIGVTTNILGPSAGTITINGSSKNLKVAMTTPNSGIQYKLIGSNMGDDYGTLIRSDNVEFFENSIVGGVLKVSISSSQQASLNPKALNFYNSPYNSTLKPSENLTSNQTYTLPNASGIIALTSDIPAQVTYSLSMTGATITLLADNVAASTITLPIYDGTIQ